LPRLALPCVIKKQEVMRYRIDQAIRFLTISAGLVGLLVYAVFHLL